MALTADQWSSLIYLRPSDFKYPDGLQYSIVAALDRFIPVVGSRPIVLSDYRAGDEKTHGAGLAIDTTWPGQEPERIYTQAMQSGFFGGVGIYLNELGVSSFHFDTRPTTLRAGEPNRWGGIITHPLDAATGQHVRRTEYVGADVVLEMVKKNAAGLTTLLIASGLAIWLIRRR